MVITRPLHAKCTGIAPAQRRILLRGLSAWLCTCARGKVAGVSCLPLPTLHTLAVDQPTAILQLPAPEVHVVCREQRMAYVGKEQLQEVLA